MEQLKNNENDFLKKLENDLEFKVKVIIGHILVANVFLDVSFYKYYSNFINNSIFDKNIFKKYIDYIDLILDGDNYTDRYSNFETINVVIIKQILKGERIVIESLKNSIYSDINNIVNSGKNISEKSLTPYDLDILDNEEIINDVTIKIKAYIQEELDLLKNLINLKYIQDYKSDFLKKIKEVLDKSE